MDSISAMALRSMSQWGTERWWEDEAPGHANFKTVKQEMDPAEDAEKELVAEDNQEVGPWRQWSKGLGKKDMLTPVHAGDGHYPSHLDADRELSTGFSNAE